MATSKVLSVSEVRASLRLPKTSFPMRANAAQREPAAVSRLTTQLYQRQWRERRDCTKLASFVLQDGPPYANGPLHIGHALNKVLKDVVNRYHLLKGHPVLFVPGWDCHGLPIELKALESLALQAKKGTSNKGKQTVSAEVALQRSDMSPLQIRAAAKAWAVAALNEQRKDFIRWGVLADWSDDDRGIYKTMDPLYEAAQLEVFQRMHDSGYLFRSVKPVFWSPSSRTALAEAELEYKDDHVSHTAFIAFPLSMTATGDVASKLKAWSTNALIWTTTPWTLPANVAISVHPDLEYSVVQFAGELQSYLVSTDRIPELQRVHGLKHQSNKTANDAARPNMPFQVLGTFSGAQLAGIPFRHPTHDRISPILCGSHVTNDSGTGLVHTAPGHGVEDFDVCRSHADLNLPVLCPVDDAGCFTSEAGGDLVGLSVLKEGNLAALQKLVNAGCVLHTESYSHRYPYDWRTKQPVLIRATKQWFANVDKLMVDALNGLSTVAMYPPVSRHRLDAMIGSRKEWCISRQRSWGVPIPVFYEKSNDEPLLTHDTMSHVIDIVAKHGTDAWWSMSVEELLPARFKADAERYRKGTDTLDVWFDSGAAWKATWNGRKDYPGCTSPSGALQPSNLVLEGSDQHRGWFQSSLLTSAACTGTAPYKSIVTHGFTLDENMRKMSKSLGNVISPQEIINGSTGPGKKLFPTPFGADVLRYWVASTDFATDVAVGPSIMTSVSESLRKIRNTARFLLGALHDLSPEEKAALVTVCEGRPMTTKDALVQMWSKSPCQLWQAGDLDSMTPLDRYMLLRLAEYNRDITSAYESFSFSKVVQSANVLTAVHLSAQYLDMIKDRLYADAVDSPRRLSARAVLYECLRHLTLSVAPVVPFVAEDIYQHSAELLGCDKRDFLVEPSVSSCVFDVLMPSANSQWSSTAISDCWNHVLDVHSKVNSIAEAARKDGAIGSCLEASVLIGIPNDHPAKAYLSHLDKHRDLSDVLSCSQVGIEPSAAVSPSDSFHEKGSGLFSYYTEAVVIGSDTPIKIQLSNAKGKKCQRCWKYCESVSLSLGHDLCARCVGVLEKN